MPRKTTMLATKATTIAAPVFRSRNPAMPTRAPAPQQSTHRDCTPSRGLAPAAERRVPPYRAELLRPDGDGEKPGSGAITRSISSPCSNRPTLRRCACVVVRLGPVLDVALVTVRHERGCRCCSLQHSCEQPLGETSVG